MSHSWSLDWSHGRTTIHSGAGAIGRTDFLLADGRRLNPFHEAPWITRGEAIDAPGLVNLRGDWPCLPFGRPYSPADRLGEPWASAVATPLPEGVVPFAASDMLLHGYGANAEWSLVSTSPDGLVVGLDYPADSAIRRATRTVRPVDGKAAMDVFVEILARQACRLPFGFHPNFALRGRPGSFRLEPGPFRMGRTHPGEDGVTRARVNSQFTSLAEVPLLEGGTGRFDQLPFADDREEILQLCGLEGGIRLVDDDARVAWTLAWDSSKLPSCLLWMSNRGRQFAPWNGENLCIGVEPIASAFDLGPSVASADNPIASEGIATTISLEADVAYCVGYRISGESLGL